MNSPTECPFCNCPIDPDDDVPLDTDEGGGFAHWACYEPFAPAIGDPDY